MNVLQTKIKQSMKTSLRRVDAWVDPDGVEHPEKTIVLEPWKKNIGDFAMELGLSVSQTYRLLRDPSREFTLQELEVFHRQLNEKNKDINGDILVPLSDTQGVIDVAREQVAREQGQEIEPPRGGAGAKLVGQLASGRSFSELLGNPPPESEEIKHLRSLVDQQSEMINNLLNIANRQQALVEKFHSEKEQAEETQQVFFQQLQKLLDDRDEVQKSA